MIKKLTLATVALLLTLGLSAQTFTGGVRGTVVSRTDRSPVPGAVLVLYQGTAEVATVTSGDDGRFLIEDLDNGIYDLVIQAPDYLETRVNVTVNDGYVKNMFNLSLTRGAVVSEVDVDNLVEFDMDDTGYGDSPTVLFGQNDVFNNMAGYNFSSVRYRVRGYSSESQDVYLAGVKMNDAITGYSPFSLWSGLNEATRTKYTVNGAEISDYGIGGYNRSPGRRLVLRVQRVGPPGRQRLGEGRVLPFLRLLCRGREAVQRRAQARPGLHGHARAARRRERVHPGGL